MIAVEKNQLKRLKQLNRTELLEVMLALKRENDILMMDNIRLKTLKHKLENEIAEIKGALGIIEQGAYETDFPKDEMLSFESVLNGFDDKVTNK